MSVVLIEKKGVELYSDATLIRKASSMTGETVSSNGNDLMLVYKSGTAKDTVVSTDGTVNVYEGGTAENTTVSSGGTLTLNGGATVKSITIQTGGTMTIDRLSGTGKNQGSGTIRVSGQLVANAKLDGIKGSTSDFSVVWDISGNKASKQSLIVNMEYLASEDFSISVDKKQETGSYILASGKGADSDNLDGVSFSISAGSTSFGKLGIGDTLKYNGINYSLVIATSGLVLRVKDVTAPKISVKASTTAMTNGTVKLTASFSDNAALASKQYSLDNKEWKTYSSAVSVTKNRTVYFRATDEAGNVTTETYKVTNIDKTSPEISIKASTTKATKSTVKLTASFSDNDAIATKQYSWDNKEWKTYSSAVSVTKNRTVYFRATDDAGNVTTAKYTVKNIDKAAPEISIKASTTKATKSTVKLTATFSDNDAVATKQYSWDNKTWKTYKSAVSVTKNRTVYFRATDEAGNVTTETYKVKNIDKTAPEISIKPNTTKTTKTVKLTASFSDNVKVSTKQYSLDNKTWKTYKSAVSVTKNRTVYFRAKDSAGNVTTETYKVKNVDRTAPEISIKPSTTKATTKTVKLTAKFSDNVKISTKQYSLDNKTWKTYKSAVSVTKNRTVYFRATDSVGNVTTETYKVTNIDKSDPKISIKASTTKATKSTVKLTASFSDDTGIATKQYSWDNKTWKTYKAAVSVTKNRTVYFRAKDEVGNVTTEKYKVTNIDKTAPKISVKASTTAETAEAVKLTASFSDNVKVSTKQYSLDNKTWKTYKSAVSVTENRTVYFRAKDRAGNLTTQEYTVKNITKSSEESALANWTDWQATGDLCGDGKLDTIVWDRNSGDICAWDNGSYTDSRLLGKLDPQDGNILAVTDFNFDGKDDLLLQTGTDVVCWADGESANRSILSEQQKNTFLASLA